jgi:catechol 2,3-dioxygenase-like lactoylglutathione lyase family enzyme
MSIVGLQRVTYGVDDPEIGARFWTDFGLLPRAGAPGERVFATEEGAEVVLRAVDDRSLPPAPIKGATAREITWAVADERALRAVAERLPSQCRRAGDGAAIRATDPAGHAIAFELSRLKPVQRAPTKFNTPGHPERVDQPAPLYPKASPVHMAHVVFAVLELDETVRFYREHLDFRLSDSYPGRGAFLRAPGASDRHNLFFMCRDGAVGFHHVAFDVRDIHEVFGGGLHMTNQGWETHIGPGRHPISSAYFWYLKNPCGGAAEYDFDTDVLTDAWQPRVFEPTPDAFAEWAFPSGAQRFKGVQTSRA